MAEYGKQKGNGYGYESGHSPFFEEKRGGQQPETEGLVLTERKVLLLSGIVQVRSFDETAILLETKEKLLHVRGTELKVERIARETKEVRITGQVESLVYTDIRGAGPRGKHLLNRLFR